MKLKRTTFMLATCLVILGTAACTKGSESGESGEQGSPISPSSSDKMYEISFMNHAYTIFPPAQGAAVDAIKEKFNAHIKSQFILAADFKDKLNVVMASGNMPDVVVIAGPMDSNYYKWARQGAFLQTDEYLNKYETFKAVPASVYNQVKVDGKVYGIPTYRSTYTNSGLIRQDWLDKLGLKMPTNYEELKQVAIAFTKDDPDGNGQKDTYGFALSQNIEPDFSMGAYWSRGWYHKNKNGQYIPGVIGPGRKEIIQTLSEAYAQGAVTKDFAALNWPQTNKEFYSGKAGIFIGIPAGMVEDYYLGLLKVNPNAKLVSIPYFKSPDGQQGGLLERGYYGVAALSSKLKNDPGKVAKILEILDYGRKFIPVNERTPQNKQFDWLMGHEGIGYDMVNGIAVLKPNSEAVTPVQYMLQRHESWRPWAPSNEANQYSKTTYKTPEMQKMIASIEEMEKKYNKEPYDDPSYSVFSETDAQKGGELSKYIIGEQTKMIVGQRPITDWDKVVQEWMDRGGAQVIQETNDAIKALK